MPSTASVRDLRNRFPKVRKLVESQGEVLLSESGKIKYRLTLHTRSPTKRPPPIDYWARLTSSQPSPMTESQADSLRRENRGDR